MDGSGGSADGKAPADAGARRASRLFALACLAEGSLLIIAALIAWPAERDLFAGLHWSWRDLGLGVVACAPLLAVFWFLMRSRLAPFARIRRLLARFFRDVAAPWSIAQIAMVSLLAGLCEEILFRGVIQGALTDWLGWQAALLATGVLFGCAHLVTFAYGVIAALLGIYLGVLWLASANLLVPVVTHAVYDFVALVYLLRHWRAHENE